MEPDVMERLGNCGGPIPGGERLPILVGHPVERCPIAMGVENQDLRKWISLVQTPLGIGELSNIPNSEVPPFYRVLRVYAADLLAAWKAQAPNA